MDRFSALINDIGALLAVYWESYLVNLGKTLLLALVATVIGCLIGLVCGILNTIPYTKNDNWFKRFFLKLVRVIVRVYVEVFRGTPMVLQAVFIFYGLPYFSNNQYRFDSMWAAAILIVSINTGAYMAESVRGRHDHARRHARDGLRAGRLDPGRVHEGRRHLGERRAGGALQKPAEPRNAGLPLAFHGKLKRHRYPQALAVCGYPAVIKQKRAGEKMHKTKKISALPALIAVLALIVCALVVGVFADGGEAEEAVSRFYGTAWSLLPPVIAIVLALITKEVYSSLFVGILIFLVILGAMVSLMNRAGGSAAFGRWAAKHIKTRVGAQLATIALGILIFVDDYFNCLTVGSVMRPVTDKHNVSRAKLSYLIDATAAPVCIIAPISSWAAAVASYVEDGPMAKFEKNAQAGDLFSGKNPYAGMEDDVPEGKGKVIDLVLPIVVLVFCCVMGMLYSGGFFTGTSWGTFGILIPITLSVFPLTDPHGVVCVSACMAGAVCGDHCSPISDTTIMASAGAQCDHVNHVSTQLPYAITCAAVSCVSYIVAGFVPNAYIALPVAILLMLGTLVVIKLINKGRVSNDA